MKTTFKVGGGMTKTRLQGGNRTEGLFWEPCILQYENQPSNLAAARTTSGARPTARSARRTRTARPARVFPPSPVGTSVTDAKVIVPLKTNVDLSF